MAIKWRNKLESNSNFDWRDFSYRQSNKPLREAVDLRPWASTIEDQRHLGSCTGNAIVGGYELLLRRDAPDKFTELSRLFVYYNARIFDNAIEVDVGAFLRDGIKAIARWGVCTETLHPYNILNFAATPSIASYVDAATRTIKNYYSIQTLDQILDALNNDYPVPFGVNVYSGFDDITTRNYIIPVPDRSEEPLGGHAMCFVGYDLPRRLLLVRNSFGVDWGDKGYCWMPFDYVLNESLDSWVFDISLQPLVSIK